MDTTKQSTRSTTTIPGHRARKQRRTLRALGLALVLTMMSLGASGIPAGANDAVQDSAEARIDERAVAIEAAASRVRDLAEERSALGAYYDRATDEHVIVVSSAEPAVVTPSDLRELGVAGRIEARDITKETVERIQATISERTFHAAAQDYTYASYLDLTRGTMVVETDAPTEVIEALTTPFRGLIEVRAGAVQTETRQDDDAPHRGGASIAAPSQLWPGGPIGNANQFDVCSSGFTVKSNATGKLFMTTAGHCYEPGEAAFSTGGNDPFGKVVAQAPRPYYDMELLGGDFYAPFIYRGGATGTSSRVVGAQDAVVGGGGYCRSGQTTFEQCGQLVISLDAQMCTKDGCTQHLMAYTGGGLSNGGDSGAPVYLPTAGGVSIRGMHIGRSNTTGTMYAERWTRIASTFGVSIAT